MGSNRPGRNGSMSFQRKARKRSRAALVESADQPAAPVARTPDKAQKSPKRRRTGKKADAGSKSPGNDAAPATPPQAKPKSPGKKHSTPRRRRDRASAADEEAVAAHVAERKAELARPDPVPAAQAADKTPSDSSPTRKRPGRPAGYYARSERRLSKKRSLEDAEEAAAAQVSERKTELARPDLVPAAQADDKTPSNSSPTRNGPGRPAGYHARAERRLSKKRSLEDAEASAEAEAVVALAAKGAAASKPVGRGSRMFKSRKKARQSKADAAAAAGPADVGSAEEEAAEKKAHRRGRNFQERAKLRAKEGKGEEAVEQASASAKEVDQGGSASAAKPVGQKPRSYAGREKLRKQAAAAGEKAEKEDEAASSGQEATSTAVTPVAASESGRKRRKGAKVDQGLAASDKVADEQSGATPQKKNRSRASKPANQVDVGEALRSPTSITEALPPAPRDHTLRIHEISFVRPHMSGILAMAAAASGNVLAVARRDGSVEVRAGNHEWATVSHHIPAGASAVTAMVFSPNGDYLLIAHKDGRLAIHRWAEDRLSLHAELRPGGGALSSIACNPTPAPGVGVEFAVGCNDGYVRLIRPDAAVFGKVKAGQLPTDPSHYTVRISEHSDGKVLSVAWAPPPIGGTTAARVVACGDNRGLVRWLDADSGKCLNDGKIASLKPRKVQICTMQFVAGGKFVVTGDNRGLACVWETASGTLVEEVQIEGMSGKLRSSAVLSPGKGNETVIFGCESGSVGGLSSGMSVTGDWLPVRGIHCHHHAVRGLAALPNGSFFTGSADTRICAVRERELHTNNTYARRSYLYQDDGVGRPACVEVIRDHRIVLSRFSRHIEIWGMPADERTKRLLTMELGGCGSELTTCALSSDATLLVASGPRAFRLFRLRDNADLDVDEFSFMKVGPLELDPKVEEVFRGCVSVRFCGSTVVAVARCRTKLIVFDNDLGVMAEYSLADMGSSASALGLLTCSNGSVAVSDSFGNVFSAQLTKTEDDVDLDFDETEKFVKLGDGCITTMGLSPSGEKLAYATLGGDVIVANIGPNNPCHRVVDATFPCIANSISFSNNGESFIVSGSSDCWIVPVMLSTKSADDEEDSDYKKYSNPKFERVSFDKALLSCAVLGRGELVGIRRNWGMVKESLPAVEPRKTKRKN